MTVLRDASTSQTTPHRARLAVLALGLGAVLTLAGCSSSGDASEAADDAPVQESSAEAPSEDGGTTTDDGAAAEEESTEASGAAAGNSAVSVTIDGEPLDVDDSIVACQVFEGTMTIAVGSADGTDGIGAVLDEGDSPAVQSVALGSVDGMAMGWAEGAPGEATATKDGNTYDIVGSMMAVDSANPAAPVETPFEMQITCP